MTAPTTTTPDEEFVMYLVVRTTLGMSPGKIGAQVGHAVEEIAIEYAGDKHRVLTADESARHAAMGAWRRQNRTKVLLSADEKEFAKARALPGAVVVVDLGRTEIAKGTETVIGLWPMRRSDRPSFLKRMRVLT